MRISIICEDIHINYVREKAKELLPNDNLPMNIPLSKTGKYPATHWLCVCFVNEDMYNKLISIRKYSIIEKVSPKSILEELELKQIGKE